MATTTLSLISEALKTEYLDVLTKFVNEQSGPFMKKIEKGTHTMSNKDAFTWFMQYGSQAGIKNIAETGEFGTANPRKYKQASLSVINFTGPIEISHKSMKVTKNKTRSVVDQLTTQMKDLSSDYRFHLRRQLFGSSSGLIATTGVTSASATIVLADDANMNKFRRGMVVDILDASDSFNALVSGSMITGIDRDAKTITIEDAVTTEVGDYVVIEDSYGIEMTGLEDILTEDSEIYGIDRSDDTYGFLNPVLHALDTSNNVDINISDLDEMIDEIEEIHGEAVDYIHGQRGPVGNFVEALRRYNVNVETQKFEAGRKVIKYGDIDIVKEPLAASNALDFYVSEHFKLAHVGDKMYDWLDEGEGILHPISNKPVYRAFLIGYMNLMCKKPSAQGRISKVKNY